MTGVQAGTALDDLGVRLTDSWSDSGDRILFLLLQVGCQDLQQHVFQILYYRHQDRVLSLVRKRLHEAPPYSDEVARELSQETWLVALERVRDHFVWPESSSNGSPLLSWLYAIAHNKVRAYVRTRVYVVSPSVAEATLLHAEDDTSLLLQDREMSEGDGPLEGDLLQRMADELNLAAEDRQILWLRHYRELSFAAIGETLGKNAGAVRTRHYRLLARIRASSFRPEPMAKRD